MERQPKITQGRLLSVFLVALVASPLAATEEKNNLISLLEAGKPAIGIWTSVGSSRMAKVHATSDLDFIVVDIEHDVQDFPALRRFLLEVQDFHHRFRTEARPAPVVLIKTGHRATWNAQFEIAQSLKAGPAMGVWVPFVESRADLEQVISAVRHAETLYGSGINVPLGEADVWPLNPKGQILVVAMIESEKGVRNAREIIETPGVGAIATAHVSREDAALIHKICLEVGVVSAANARPDTIKARVDAGYKLISLGWDFGMLHRHLSETLKGMRTALSK
jgi:4-hydroxy-2-oxoheptanedioate aldolase